MTYIDTTYRDVSHIAGAEQGDDRFVFMASRQRLPLRTEVDGDGPVPEGAVPVQVFRRDTGSRLGQFAADEGSLDDLRSLLGKPRRLGMGCKEEYPGLVGQLVVLVPASVVADLFENLGSDDDEEPWRDSLPEPPDLGDSVQGAAPTDPTGGPLEGGPGPAAGPGAGPGGPPAPGDPGPEAGADGFEAQEDEDEDQMRFGALPLGNVVRFGEDREHPTDFVEEATDIFEVALEGDLPPVSERLIQELAAESSAND